MRNNKMILAAAATAIAPVFANAPKKENEAAVVTGVVTGLTMPKVESKRGIASVYPFDKLEVGACFGVKNKTAKQLSAVISNAHRRFRVNKTDGEGNVVYKMQEIKDAQGNVTGRVPTQEPEQVPGRHFFAVDVTKEIAEQIKDNADLKGSTALVWRDK